MGIQAGQTLANRYQVEQLLGQGMAQTYSGWRLVDDLPVVIKALHFGQVQNWKTYELFEREVKILQNLKHPAIPRFLDSFKGQHELDTWHYLVIERVPGQNLEQAMASGWRPSEAELTQLALKALEILSYLHSLSPAVIHRDLKPSNLILHESELYLIDFGAVQDAMRSEGSSTVVGTFGYMAPEQFSGRAFPATDLYGLGATLLHILAGRSPAELPQKELKLDFRQDIHCSRQLANWLEKMLEPAHEHRFQTAAEARQALLNPSLEPYALQRSAPASELRNLARPRKPAGSRVELVRSGRKLHLTLPPGNLKAHTVSIAFFAVFWNSLVAFWTVGSLWSGGIFFAVFALPFWAAGFFMARLAARGLFMQTVLEFSPDSYTLSEQLGPLSKTLTGRTQDIQSLNYNLRYKVNNLPVFALQIEAGVDKHHFGANLSRVEQQWLQAEILAYLVEYLPAHRQQELLALSDSQQ